jgi:uncharacterized membrane protein YbhN (UPF0104 family)
MASSILTERRGSALRWGAAWNWRHALLTAAVLVALGWTLVSIADLPAVLTAAGAIWTRPDLLALFVVSYSAALFLRAIAWRLLLRRGPGVVRLFGFLQAGLLANHLFPVKAGEAVRALLLVRSGIAVRDASASTLIARLLDLTCLCGLGIAWAVLTTEFGTRIPVGLAIPLTMVLVGAAVVVAFGSGHLRLVWAHTPAPLAALGRDLETAVRAMSVRRVALALLVTLPSWILEALALWCVATAAGTAIPPALAIGATAFTIALQGLQVTPGGIGLYEASLTAALTLYGIDPGTALGLAVATHALKFAYAYAVGLACLSLEALPTGAIRHSRGLHGLRLRGLRSLSRPLRWLRLLWPTLVPFGLALLASAALSGGIPQPLGVLTLTLTGSVAAIVGRQWWTSHRPLPSPAPLAHNSLIAIVIPVHNEVESVGSVIDGVPRRELAALRLRSHVIVVDDGSSDSSARAATVAGAEDVICHPRRRGLGAALRTGLATARERGADAAVYLDADGEYDPRDMPALLRPLLDGSADYVLGSRFPIAGAVMRPSRLFGNRAFTLLLRALTCRRIDDGQTGYRAFGPRALRRAEIIHDYNYAQVLTLDLLRKGMRLTQVPIAYQVRCRGRSFIRYGEYARRVLPAIARELFAP